MQDIIFKKKTDIWKDLERPANIPSSTPLNKLLVQLLYTLSC
jgi:hypothetical protein